MVGPRGVVEVHMPIQAADDLLAVIEGRLKSVPITAVFEFEEFRVLPRTLDLEGMEFKRAESPTEIDLGMWIDLLSAEKQHPMLVPECFQLGAELIRQVIVDIETENFDADILEGACLERHGIFSFDCAKS